MSIEAGRGFARLRDAERNNAKQFARRLRTTMRRRRHIRAGLQFRFTLRFGRHRRGLADRVYRRQTCRRLDPPFWAA